MARTTKQRTISLPPDLDALYIEHAPRLLPLSTLAARSLRSALRRLGVPVPEAPDPYPRAKAVEAARVGRVGEAEES